MWSSRTFSIKCHIPNQQNGYAFFVANTDDLVGSYLETIECKAFVIIFISFIYNYESLCKNIIATIIPI